MDLITDDLGKRIQNFIRGERSEVYFSDLFVKLAQRQTLTNKVYYKYLTGLGVDPRTWRTWQDVVPLPVQLFKTESVVSYGGGGRVTFKSSGTQGNRSIVKLQHSDFYDLALEEERWIWSRHLPEEYRTLRLFPNFNQWPNSSLAYMYDRMFGCESPDYLDVKPAEFDWNREAVYQDLLEAQSTGLRRIIFGTSYTMIQLFDYLLSRGPLKLPPGSLIIDTGGSKNIERSLDRSEYLLLMRMSTGLPSESSLIEYGMSEMSSPFWGVGDRFLDIPDWVRVRTVNPLTNKDDIGGTLAIYDLANVYTVAAIQTQDLAVINSLNSRQMMPLGRAEGALPKGCSLLAQDGIH